MYNTCRARRCATSVIDDWSSARPTSAHDSSQTTARTWRADLLQQSGSWAAPHWLDNFGPRLGLVSAPRRDGRDSARQRRCEEPSCSRARAQYADARSSPRGSAQGAPRRSSSDGPPRLAQEDGKLLRSVESYDDAVTGVVFSGEEPMANSAQLGRRQEGIIMRATSQEARP
jgi:hypothetical protein